FSSGGATATRRSPSFVRYTLMLSSVMIGYCWRTSAAALRPIWTSCSGVYLFFGSLICVCPLTTAALVNAVNARSATAVEARAMFFQQYRLRSGTMKALAVAVAVTFWSMSVLAQPQDSPFSRESLDLHARQVAMPITRSPVTASAYVPITSRERIEWIVIGTIGVRSLTLVGPLSAGWSTAFNTPEEWGQSWEGFGKRYLAREADVAISNTLEAGTGALWGEDPR